MNTQNLLVAAGTLVAGALLTIPTARLVEKLAEKNPKLRPHIEPVINGVSGVVIGAAGMYLVKNQVTTKSEAGAILASGSDNN